MVNFTFKKQVVTKPQETVDVLNNVQDSCLRIVEGLNSLPLNQSIFIQSSALSTTAAPIRHGLGYKARGFLLCNPSAAFDVYEDTTAANPDQNNFIMVRTSAGSYSVNLIIF